LIITSINGGLGNQLFQYAAGRTLAHLHQTELVLDLSWFDLRPNRNTPRRFELMNYPISGRLLDQSEKKVLRFYQGKILSRIHFLPRRWTIFREKSFHFDPKFFVLPNDVYLKGYWQSPLYFDAIRSILLDEFAPIHPPGPANEILINEMSATNSVSIHVRRGDYLSNPFAAKYHGVCSLEYYQEAIRLVGRSVEKPHFFVFSDDLEWAKSNIVFDHPVKFIGHNVGSNAFQDIRLISICKHQIIANSSFSWWGAWLNKNQNKIVIAPKTWLLVQKDTSTLIPKEWIRL